MPTEEEATTFDSSITEEEYAALEAAIEEFYAAFETYH